MPKIARKEAAIHRHRQGMLDIPKRFLTRRTPGFTHEYDRQYSSLRVSWSGNQQFFSQHETRSLYAFLKGIYESVTKQAAHQERLRRSIRETNSIRYMREHSGDPDTRMENDWSYLENNGTGQAWNV